MSGRGMFDVVLTFWSSTIFKNTLDTDPWAPVGIGYEKWHQGYVPCLVMRLSHLKWAKIEGDKNPSWAMSAVGVAECLNDLKSLISPMLSLIKSDEALMNCLMKFKNNVPPTWVRSVKPGIKDLDILIDALGR